MESFKSDWDKNDFGEIIEMVRLKMSLSVDGFASLIGTKSKEVVNAEEGLYSSCYNVIEKMLKNKRVRNYIDIKIEFTLK